MKNGIMDQVVAAGERLGPSLLARLRQNIIDEMPTGSHEERARAWARLGRRCFEAAAKHQAVADERARTKQYVCGFAPEYRQTALEAYKRQLHATPLVGAPLPSAARKLTTLPGLGSPSLTLTVEPEAFDDLRRSLLLPPCSELKCVARIAPRDLPVAAAPAATDDGEWRALTADELATQEVWTGRYYRQLTIQEGRDGRTAEPTLGDPSMSEQVP